jgi:hypothetical protein
MRAHARTAVFCIVAALVVFVSGLSVGVGYGGRSGIRWNNDLGWQPIATLTGAILSCLTVVAVAWAITNRLQQRQSNKAFERELLAGFVRSALGSATRINEQVSHCRKQNAFAEAERQEFILLFTALGQDIQLISDALEAIAMQAPAADAAHRCRGEYKDLLTDRALASRVRFAAQNRRALDRSGPF